MRAKPPGARGLEAAYEALPRPALWGHRGSGGAGTENTLAAIEAAAAEGAVGVEIDIRLCASGEPVVVHDRSLDRITGGADRRLVEHVRLAELGRVPLAGGGTIPTLSDVLALCRARSLGLNVEMKRDVPSPLRLVRAAARALGHARPDHALVVSSFDPVMLAALRLLAPHVPTALLLHRSGQRYRLVELVRRLGVRAVHLERTLASPARVARCKAAGLRVVVWTVNDPNEAADLLDRQVDGLITDLPARLGPVLGRAARRAGAPPTAFAYGQST